MRPNTASSLILFFALHACGHKESGDPCVLRGTLAQVNLSPRDCTAYRVVGVVTLGNSVLFSPGTRLEFETDAGWVVPPGIASYVRGTEAAPIEFLGKDPTPGSWKGIGVFGTMQAEYLKISHAGAADESVNLGHAASMYLAGRFNGAVQTTAGAGAGGYVEKGAAWDGTLEVSEHAGPLLDVDPSDMFRAAQLTSVAPGASTALPVISVRGGELPSASQEQHVKRGLPFRITEQVTIRGRIELLADAEFEFTHDAGFVIDEKGRLLSSGPQSLTFRGIPGSNERWQGIRAERDSNVALYNVRVSDAQISVAAGADFALGNVVLTRTGLTLANGAAASLHRIKTVESPVPVASIPARSVGAFSGNAGIVLEVLGGELNNPETVQQWNFPEGELRVMKSVTMKGWDQLSIGAGVQLYFAPSASLIVASAAGNHEGLTVRGTAAAPVNLSALTSEGWGGVKIVSGDAKLEHVRIGGAGLSEADIDNGNAAAVYVAGSAWLSQVTIGYGVGYGIFKTATGTVTEQDVTIAEQPLGERSYSIMPPP